jgi:4,5:9,10-diseco-3-hydroxy-5,9,17-trioxoandrosta-1(10),2-diene-4-oate hydrolase
MTAIAQSWREHTVEVGARRIFVAEQGSGPAVLMLHGGGPGATGASNYARNVGPLAERFRVIVPDLPGYGRSTKGLRRDDPFGDLAEAMNGLLPALGLEQAHVVGNSLGGACALRLALEHPGRVTSLILMGPGGIGTSRALPTRGLSMLLGYYAGQGPTREKLARFIRDYLVHDGRTVPDELIEARFQGSIDPQIVAAPPLQRPRGLRALLKMDLTRDRRLARCATPTLVIWGKNDLVNRPSGGPRLQATMPRCDLYVVSDAGHWVQWERPEEFNALATAFLSRNPPHRGGLR